MIPLQSSVFVTHSLLLSSVTCLLHQHVPTNLGYSSISNRHLCLTFCLHHLPSPSATIITFHASVSRPSPMTRLGNRRSKRTMDGNHNRATSAPSFKQDQARPLKKKGNHALKSRYLFKLDVSIITASSRTSFGSTLAIRININHIHLKHVRVEQHQRSVAIK
ncbi:hypothetical protein B0T10DRAFT_103332 [Thelonectria olida]|uniref:Uncharacterized protein n=1 Tax=Thelonectria olida TaxID=1576542 RepID=A0A9P8WHW6_9HYPO|nr:hypothetical protein B0T10DRAFT_103332 [Thelonectria olida]